MDTSWDPVTSPGNCNLTYRVSWNHTTNLDPNITTDNYFNITGLSYFTTYEVCVDPWVEGLTTIKKCEISTTVTSGKLSDTSGEIFSRSTMRRQ
ncbi:hypothetical protein Pcinc_014845 [Petrolisthes cinctipes]|uniref:Fibronectin type-III domain-containing protein n=1 Tax=Petrolisthes cinctipes TaxID=88211 RepID=A0AAE1KQC5_PETCI|nr:hypothetical protein Pcinc_014845 [Petrolisthes cinctipes]